MYIEKNIVYSEPGKYLRVGNKIGFQFNNIEGVEECDINYDFKIVGDIVCYNNGTLAQRFNKSWKYSDYKKDIIKKRYSNDDQLAIILNKDDSVEDLLRYQRMMEWREFASEFAHKLINLQNA